jgi:hypothetical protein
MLKRIINQIIYRYRKLFWVTPIMVNPKSIMFKKNTWYKTEYYVKWEGKSWLFDELKISKVTDKEIEEELKGFRNLDPIE